MEVAVVLVLLSTVLALGISTFRGSPERASVRGLAESFASEILTVREAAITSGLPTALVIPTQGGSKAHSQAFYIVQGHQNPKLLRAASFANEFPDGVIFVGHWPLVGGKSHQNGLTVAGANQRDFDPGLWSPPEPADTALIFLPSGSVVFPGVTWDNAVHFTICDGLDYSAATLSGVTSHLLTEVHSPYTVSVSAGGEVDVHEGLSAESPGAVNRQSLGAVSTPGAPLNAFASGPNTDPAGLVITPYPIPIPGTLPPGVDATINHDGILTLEATASDVDGDNLRCSWQSEAAAGAYSVNEEVEMEWDVRNQNWRSTWGWAPPPSTPDGTVYRLSCTVTDPNGGSVSGQVGAAGQVLVLHRSGLCYTKDVGGQADVVVSNSDGTEERRLTDHPANDYGPRPSPDGSKIVFTSDRNGIAETFIMNHDGTDVQQLASSADVGGGEQGWACVSAGGQRVAFTVNTVGGEEVWYVNADGSNPLDSSLRGPSRIPGSFQAQPAGVFRGLTWAGNDRLITGANPLIVDRGQTRPSQLIELKLDGTVTPIGPAGFPVVEPEVNHSLTMITWNSSLDTMMVGDYSPGSLTNIRTSPVSPLESPRFSPDDTQFTGQVGRPRDNVVVNADGTQRQTLRDPLGADDDSTGWILR
jgi:type II secretory pathway pseudopilin PulG